jgi:hypothetical protein
MVKFTLFICISKYVRAKTSVKNYEIPNVNVNVWTLSCFAGFLSIHTHFVRGWADKICPPLQYFDVSTSNSSVVG